VQIEFTEWVNNPNFKANNNQFANLMRHQNDLAREQQALSNAKNPRDAQHHMNQIAHLQNTINQEMMKLGNVNPNNMPFKPVQHAKDFDLDIQENVVYRKMFLPQEYDDTGNLKTYSKEQIAELKGKNPNPKDSFSAKSDEFHPGQTVGVYLTPPPKKTSTKDDGGKDAKTDDDKMQKPTVRMLVLMQEGTASSTTDKNPPKKKN
jgi:hypothetical protein